MSRSAATSGGPLETFLVFLRLGVTSFGGPIAHLGYFRSEFVARRHWLDEREFADIVALCQFLPGPSSSQVGLTIGYRHGGLTGAAAAWIGFTAPSALALIAFGYGMVQWGGSVRAPWLHGLQTIAVAVVAQAVWSMARSLCPDRPRASLAAAAAILSLSLPSAFGQIGAIAAGGLVGWRFLSAPEAPRPPDAPDARPRTGWALGALILFVVLLLGLPLARAASASHALALVDSFFRSGALVFGGGHVVLPLLQQATVPQGWIGDDAFLAGYGAAQAVPGPLFAFAAYLGTVMSPAPNGWIGGVLCLMAIYLPSFLLLAGVLPFWDALRQRAPVQAALRGVNAAVVGLLLAALYRPVWVSTILGPADFGLALVAFILLVFWRAPPWSVVVFGALCGEALAALA